jgi:hypothetical protein
VTFGIIHISSSGISKLWRQHLYSKNWTWREKFLYRVLKLVTVATLSVYSCVLWWKLFSRNIQRNESILEETSRYRFQLQFIFLIYRITCYLIFRRSYFAQNVEFWLSYPVYSSTDSEKWNLCETPRLCLRIVVSTYLNSGGDFHLIRAPVALTPVPIRKRSCLSVEERQNYRYPSEDVAAVCKVYDVWWRDTYDGVSKIFRTGTAIYTAVVVARSTGRW